MRIQRNSETWNRSTSNGVTRRRVLLNRFYLPRVFPNGYRYTPFVVTHKNNAPGSELRPDLDVAREQHKHRLAAHERRLLLDAREVHQRGPVSK